MPMRQSVFCRSIILFIALALPGLAAYAGQGTPIFYDLSHPIPLFEPREGDSTKSDLSRPVNDSKPVAGSGGDQGVRTAKPNLSVANGTVQWGYFFLEEHYGTHVDSTNHHLTNNESLITVAEPDQRSVDEYSLQELIGPIVYIDISDRVRKELAKNGGKPSPDRSVTNFDNDSGNNVSAADIDAVADQLVDGAYIVINTGWEPLYEGPPPTGSNWSHSYSNMLNHPGLTPDAVDRIVAIEKARGIRIAGLAADNIAVESGHSIRGPKMGTDTVNPNEFQMYLHAVGLPRGWKVVENAANLAVLAGHQAGECTLIIGALKLAGASGSPARLIAMCEGG